MINLLLKDNMVDLSIIICSYNGVRCIKSSLEYISKQKVDSTLNWELILVDNASTDSTADYVLQCCEEFNLLNKIKIVYEEKPGLLYARIAGIRECKGDIIIFCDDDNWLRNDYVQSAYNIMKEKNDIGVMGGQSVLTPNTNPPVWWKENQGNYAVGKQLKSTGYANERGFVYGAGLVTRKEIAVKIFDSQFPLMLTGRKGNECLSGEDWEYCQRVLLLNYNIYYSEDLFYWHDISPERLTIEKLNQLLYSFKLGELIAEKYRYILRFNKLNYLRKLLLLIKRLVAYVFSNSINRKRKLFLLRSQVRLCGLTCIHDSELDNILGWINKYK